MPTVSQMPLTDSLTLSCLQRTYFGVQVNRHISTGQGGTQLSRVVTGFVWVIFE
jgi:hypothetical protein